VQANSPLLRNCDPLFRKKNLTTYPIVLFDRSIGFGKKKILDRSSPAFWISDFPLPRKSTFWESAPSTLYFQPDKIFPLPLQEENFTYPKLLSISETPSFSDWEKNIERFKKSNLEKVVLARRTSFTFEKQVSPLDLFHFLKKRSPNAFVFAIILNDNLAFVGASPEKLFIRNGLEIETEALAGTKSNIDESSLLTSSKDLKEFLFVKETLTDQLQKICNPFSINQNILIKKAGNVSHLHSTIKATLKEAISDADLIRYLHPTPAIGGRPKDLALKFIDTFEPFDRGWYAGSVGLLSKESSRVYVGIRSALIEDKTIHVFSGAGIIPESNPLHEWQELDHKQGLFNIC
jgi:menaquinone-specific isochorismate synthase